MTTSVLSIEHLVMSDQEIELRKNSVEDDLTLEIYISPGGDKVNIYSSELNKQVETITSEPYQWQLDWIRTCFSKLNTDLNLTIKEVFTYSGVNDNTQIPIYITTVPDAYSVSGSWDLQNNDPVFLSMTQWEEGGIHTKSSWQKIFTHELGHLLGLEHP